MAVPIGVSSTRQRTANESTIIFYVAITQLANTNYIAQWVWGFRYKTTNIAKFGKNFHLRFHVVIISYYQLKWLCLGVALSAPNIISNTIMKY